MTAIIIIVVLVFLVVWIVGVQRNLVSQEELVKNALSQIGVQQSSRWDALTALVELVKSYNEHEYNTLRDVIAARRTITGESSVADANEQEAKLTSALKQINVVAEQYPDLKANENYAKAMDAVNTYENQVRTSRMVYNDTVTKYNKLIRQIPECFVASLLHFTAKEYFNVEEQKTSMPSMKI